MFCLVQYRAFKRSVYTVSTDMACVSGSRHDWGKKGNEALHEAYTVEAPDQRYNAYRCPVK